MSRQNDLTLQDIEKVKRGIIKISESLSRYLNDKDSEDVQSDIYNRENKRRSDRKTDNYDESSLVINFPESVNITIDCKINRNSSKSHSRYNREDDEYMKVQKRLNWAGGFYMPR